jgi:hypothetical protein
MNLFATPRTVLVLLSNINSFLQKPNAGTVMSNNNYAVVQEFAQYYGGTPSFTADTPTLL